MWVSTAAVIINYYTTVHNWNVKHVNVWKNYNTLISELIVEIIIFDSIEITIIKSQVFSVDLLSHVILIDRHYKGGFNVLLAWFLIIK